MNRLNDYYDNIKLSRSPEEMAQAVISRAKKTQKKHSFKPLAVVAVATVVFTAGMTAGAATGLINFNDIFGGKIVAGDEALASNLIAAADNLEWTISNDEYTIDFKGITGSESDMLMLYNIVRKDGKPVTVFMTNIPDDGVLYCMADTDFRAPDEAESSKSIKNTNFKQSSGCSRYTINSDGNIEVYKRVTTDGSIAGQYYSEEILNIYPDKLLTRFTDENKLHLWGNWGDTPTGFYPIGDNTAFENKQPLDISINDERIIGLELEWSIGFTYSPSKLGVVSRSLENGEIISLSYWKTFAGGNTDTRDFEITDSYFSSVGGRIDCINYGDKLYGYSFENHNDILIVLDDGTTIPCTAILNNCSYTDNNDEVRLSLYIQYSDTKNGTITAIDITKAEAVSINGTIYSLD